MNFFSRMGQDIVLPLQALWDSFIYAIPYVIGGIIVLLFGYLLGEVLEVIAIKILKKVKFNEFIHNLKISKNLERFDISHFLGVLLKWYVFIIFLVPAASLAKLGELSVLLIDFARWVPSFILAILIVLFGWIAADVLANKIESTKIKSRHFVSMFVKLVIFIFIFAVALEQIGVAVAFLHQVFLVILAALAFGFALAVGLGFSYAMKDDAKKMLKDIRKKF